MQRVSFISNYLCTAKRDKHCSHMMFRRALKAEASLEPGPSAGGSAEVSRQKHWRPNDHNVESELSTDDDDV